MLALDYIKYGEQFMKITWNDYRKNLNRYVTNSAFAEYNIMPTYKSTFTTADEDHDGLISFSKLFLSYYMDPSESRFVEDVFEGDWKHWEQFKTAQNIDEMYRLLRKQADKKLESEAMNRVISIAFDENNKNNLQALKFIIDGKAAKAEKPVGRPKKEKKEPEIDSKELLADIKRLQ